MAPYIAFLCLGLFAGDPVSADHAGAAAAIRPLSTIRPRRTSARHQRVEGVYGLLCLCARCRDGDRAADPGPEHHQPHDGVAGRQFPRRGVTLIAALSLNFSTSCDEFGGGACVQSFLIDDLDERASPRRRGQQDRSFPGKHAARNRDVFLAGFLSGCDRLVERALGPHLRELHQHGQVDARRPPRHSGRFMTEIDRLEGVPPNMSVRITTPSP